MVLDATLLNTQHYKVKIKGKVEQSWERSGDLPLHLGVVAIEKGAFRSPLTTVANFTLYCLVGWGCRIHWLHLCRGVNPPPHECPGYDTKQSDGEVPAILEPWLMRSTTSLPLLPGPLWPGVVAPDWALSMG